MPARQFVALANEVLIQFEAHCQQSFLLMYAEVKNLDPRTIRTVASLCVPLADPKVTIYGWTGNKLNQSAGPLHFN